jgi:hypothetical protein
MVTKWKKELQEQSHQSLGYKTPAEVHALIPTPTPVVTVERGMVKSFVLDPLTVTGFHLNSTPILS